MVAIPDRSDHSAVRTLTDSITQKKMSHLFLDVMFSDSANDDRSIRYRRAAAA